MTLNTQMNKEKTLLQLAIIIDTFMKHTQNTGSIMDYRAVYSGDPDLDKNVWY
jgi:hypothetical protein